MLQILMDCGVWGGRLPSERDIAPVSSFEIKGKVVPVPLFRPLTPDIERLGEDISRQLSHSPEFFHNMALIIDIAALGELRNHLELPRLTQKLRDQGLQIIGIQGGNELHNKLAPQLGLSIFPDNGFQQSKAPSPSPETPSTALLIDRPVRSGQQIYAKNRDMVVMAPVGEGSEVIADGSIHIYSVLRGRAMAGVSGDESARIFCKELHAELVSISGLYKVSEDIPAEMQGGSAMIRMHNEQLLIEPL